MSLLPNTAWPDILTADQPQPVDPLLVGQTDGFRSLAHFAPKNAKPVGGLTGEHILNCVVWSRATK